MSDQWIEMDVISLKYFVENEIIKQTNRLDEYNWNRLTLRMVPHYGYAARVSQNYDLTPGFVKIVWDIHCRVSIVSLKIMKIININGISYRSNLSLYIEQVIFVTLHVSLKMKAPIVGV